MSAELALQEAIRARLISSPLITVLVPADNILDRNARPNPDPAIVIGEGQSVDEGDSLSRNLTRIYMDLHIWKIEVSTVGVKLIAGAIRKALMEKMTAVKGFHIVDCYVQNARWLRDPDGETSHAVLTVSSKVQEL